MCLSRLFINFYDADKVDGDGNFIEADIHPCSTCYLSNDGSHVLGGVLLICYNRVNVTNIPLIIA